MLFQTEKNMNKTESFDPLILTTIYQDDINIPIWKRSLDDKMIVAAKNYISTTIYRELSLSLNLKDAETTLNKYLANFKYKDYFSNDIVILVDMFCCLFDLNKVGLRLSILKNAMCPRFHVDKVPCRLVTTYLGKGTEWLYNSNVNRKILGHAEQDVLNKHIMQCNTGDVALLKGEEWEGNTDCGLVHRSPAIKNNMENRLILTLDFIN